MNQDEVGHNPLASFSSVPSSGSSVWILPSPQESDTSNRSTRYLAAPEARTNEQLQPGGLPRTPSRASTASSVASAQVFVGDATTTTDDSSTMIMPDDAIETGDFRYPTPDTFGPQYWERRRELWLAGQLYPNDPTQPPVKPYSGSNNLPWISPEAANGTTSSHTSLSQYLGLSLKARGKLPSFLVNALPHSSSSSASNTATQLPESTTTTPTNSTQPHAQDHTSGGPVIPANPSSLAQDRAGAAQGQGQPMSYGHYQAARASPWTQKKGGDDPIDRLEALLAEPGAEESDRAWKQGGLEAVWRFLIDGKTLKRGIRLGLAVKILRAGWIHDGTWPATYTMSGGSRSQLEFLNNDPFFASPPRVNTSLPRTDMRVNTGPEPIDIPQTTDPGVSNGACPSDQQGVRNKDFVS